MQIVTLPEPKDNANAATQNSLSFMSWIGMDRATDLSVILAAAVVLVYSAGGSQRTLSRNPVWMALLILVWYWTTSTWAVETKNIVQAFSSGGGTFPLLGFWLTFAPQLVSAAIFAGRFSQLGVEATKDIYTLGYRSAGGFWLVAGAAFWFGQFFTVQSMIFGAPALTFIVKAAEPLSTALLAGWVLKKAYSLPLLLGVVIACAGIMLCVASAHQAQGNSAHTAHEFQSMGLVFAVLANLGFSSRACLAKKALGQLHLDPLAAYGMMSIVGGIAGLLPLFAWVLTAEIGLAGTAQMCPFFDPRFSLQSWLMMCLSYLLYQTCSILILSCVAVESHSLLVAMKHMLVVVLVSLLVHANLNKGIVIGMAWTVLGVYVYTRSIGKDDPKESEHLCATQDTHLEEAKILGAGVTRKVPETPQALDVFVMVLALIGAATSPVMAFMQAGTVIAD